MCAPLLIPLALTAVSTIGGIFAAQSQANAANAAADQNNAFANENALLQQQGLSNQAEEINEVAAEEQSDAAREAMILRGKVRTAQGETGGYGNTSAALLRDVGFQEGLQVNRINANAGRKLRQTGLERKKINLDRRSRVASNNASRVSKTDTALQIAGTVAGGAASAYNTIKG